MRALGETFRMNGKLEHGWNEVIPKFIYFTNHNVYLG